MKCAMIERQAHIFQPKWYFNNIDAHHNNIPNDDFNLFGVLVEGSTILEFHMDFASTTQISRFITMPYELFLKRKKITLGHF